MYANGAGVGDLLLLITGGPDFDPGWILFLPFLSTGCTCQAWHETYHFLSSHERQRLLHRAFQVLSPTAVCQMIFQVP